MQATPTLNTPGRPPGTLEIHPEATPPRIHVMAYKADGFVEEHDVTVERVVELDDDWPFLWVDVIGLGDADTLRELGRHFGLHPLVLEDVVHVAQRSKVEEYDDYEFIVVRMVASPEDIETEQLAMVVKNDCVITFQERSGDCLDPVRQRLRRDQGRIRRSGPDYLAYSLIDTVVDHYMPLLDWLGERIDDAEREIINGARPAVLGEVYDLKHAIFHLRRVLLPLRDAVGKLHREEMPLFSVELDPYLRDCYDHIIRLLETLELYRENATALMELYMTSVSHRMNEVMKVLTIIATIFIPLSFIASLYGMNFDPEASPYNMPELEWRFGYLYALALMAALALGLLGFFYRKGWIGQRHDHADDGAAPPDPPA
jgi:magnesium transporter